MRRLELGYLSHPGDAARLADPAFRDTVAEAVVSAVQTLFLPEGALASDVADLREARVAFTVEGAEVAPEEGSVLAAVRDHLRCGRKVLAGEDVAATCGTG